MPQHAKAHHHTRFLILREAAANEVILAMILWFQRHSQVLQLSLLKAPGYNTRAADTTGTILTSNQLLFEDTATIDFYSVYMRCSIEPGGYDNHFTAITIRDPHSYAYMT